MGILSRFRKKDSDAKKVDLTGPAVTPTVVPAIESATPAVRSGTGKNKIAWRTLIRPLVSEKASHVGLHNQYIFVVQPSATKVDIRRAIHDAYGIMPVRVNIIRVRGKAVRYGRSAGRTKSWKKAIVTLPKGKKIQVYEGV